MKNCTTLFHGAVIAPTSGGSDAAWVRRASLIQVIADAAKTQ
jgi:hypothetical protein